MSIMSDAMKPLRTYQPFLDLMVTMENPLIGILTAVAYQIVIADIQPDIAYMTLMHGFLNLSFLLMCAAVVVNLVVGSFERRGDPERARAVDRKSRWIFPLLYFGLNGVIVAIAFIAF